MDSLQSDDDPAVTISEYGVVVHCWLDKHHFYQCFVTFFGDAFPEGSPKIEELEGGGEAWYLPYTLSYASASLQVVGSLWGGERGG
ncbi:MAG: hypothetical protein AAGE03_02645 [Pseudomonadota bacterium]